MYCNTRERREAGSVTDRLGVGMTESVSTYLLLICNFSLLSILSLQHKQKQRNPHTKNLQTDGEKKKYFQCEDLTTTYLRTRIFPAGVSWRQSWVCRSWWRWLRGPSGCRGRGCGHSRRPGRPPSPSPPQGSSAASGSAAPAASSGRPASPSLPHRCWRWSPTGLAKFSQHL